MHRAPTVASHCDVEPRDRVTVQVKSRSSSAVCPLSPVCPSLPALCLPEAMKETVAKRRDKAGGRDRDSKADKSKDAGPEPQDVEMPEEEATNAAKQPKEQDSLTLDGKPRVRHTV